MVVLVSPTESDGAVPPSVEFGAELYAVQCAGCHGSDGGGVQDRGPTLLDEGEASADFVLRTGRMPLADPDAQARRGPVRYTDEEIEALVAFVGSIGSGPDTPLIDTAAGDTADGGVLYRLNCAACHVAVRRRGTDRRGTRGTDAAKKTGSKLKRAAKKAAAATGMA